MRFCRIAWGRILREVPIMTKQELSEVLREKTASVLGRIKEGVPYKIKEVEYSNSYDREKRTMTIEFEDNTTLIVMLWETTQEEKS
jgi:hypothetical protein